MEVVVQPSLFLSGVLWLWASLVPAAPLMQPIDPRDIGEVRQFSSARFILDASAVVDDQATVVRASGAYVQPDRVQMSIDVSGQHVEAIIIGSDTWTRAGTSGPWQRASGAVSPTAPVPGVSPAAPTALPPGATDKLLQVVRGFRLLETGQLRGLPVRRYQGEIDVARLVALLAPGQSITPQQMEALSGVALGFDLWIGVEDRYIHQMAVRLDVSPEVSRALGPGFPKSLHLSYSVGFTDFDQPIQIQPPETAPRPAPAPTPRPAPAQAPAQVPRSPNRLPSTGDDPRQSATAVFAGGLASLAAGWLLRRRRYGDRIAARTLTRASAAAGDRRPGAQASRGSGSGSR
jgi:LPXTG-motif cell wall-anchored protein